MNLEKALGAGKPASVQKISLYSPERDSDDAPVPDIEKGIEAAMWPLGEINRGATRLPAFAGAHHGASMGYDGVMADEPDPPEEAPWEVNEYKFEPPGWFEFLIAGNPGVYPPLILVLIYVIWRWATG